MIWAKNMKRLFTRQDIEIANKYLKRCIATNVIIRGKKRGSGDEKYVFINSLWSEKIEKLIYRALCMQRFV